MTVNDVKSDIRNKSPKNYYVFTGEEIAVMNIFIKKIAEVANASICRADTLGSIYSKMQNKSFLSTRSCFVIRDDKEYLSTEDAWTKLEEGSIQNNNIVIMLYTDLDKRSKFYKHIQDKLVVFEALTDENLKREIQKRIALSDKNCMELIDICEHNFGAILNEVDKIRNYISGDRPDGKSMTHDQSFEQLLNDGTIHQPARDVIWDFVDAVLMRHINKAFVLLDEALEYGNPTLTLISVLYRDTKQLLQVQECDSGNVSKTTGLSDWDIKRARSRFGRYSVTELRTSVRLIRDVEKNIKSGLIEDTMALDYILVSMLRR